MQAMSGIGGLPPYSFSQVSHTPISHYTTPQQTPASTSSVVNLPPPIKQEIQQTVSEDSKESVYNVYDEEIGNDVEGCSSSRSNVSPRSQDELPIAPYGARGLLRDLN
ncbi:hypothetical protein AB6A40_008608 [Gnathostoma spinigerum]|uniref:Uncharacterized protein n=1 Tax=Gnathostoma spinigerum TaxID=75299 RepID=A0ABD6EPK0_9BILA